MVMTKLEIPRCRRTPMSRCTVSVGLSGYVFPPRVTLELGQCEMECVNGHCHVISFFSRVNER